MKSTFKTLAGNTVIFAIGNSVSLLLAFIMVPFYTKMLSPSDFGISDIITTTTAMLVPLMSLNVFAAIFRFALDDDNHDEIFTNGLIISIIGGTISIIAAIALSFFNIKYATMVGIYIALTLFMNLFQNFTRGINHVKSFALSGIIATLTNIGSNILLMWVFKLGLNGYLISLLISTIITSIFLFINNKLYNYISFKKTSISSTKYLLKYSIPMIPNSFAWWLTNDANKIIILLFLGPSANGIMAVANKIPSLINTLFGMFANAWQMTAVKEDGKDETSKLYTITFNVIFGSLFVGSAIIVNLIQWFMSFYVSPQFFSAWKIVPILLVTAIFSNMSAFFGTTYLVAKQTKGLFTTTVWGTIINIALSSILIPIVGLMGAGISGAIGFLIVSILRFIQTKHIISFKINIKFLILIATLYTITSIFAIIQINWVSIIATVLMLIVLLINTNKLLKVKL